MVLCQTSAVWWPRCQAGVKTALLSEWEKLVKKEDGVAGHRVTGSSPTVTTQSLPAWSRNYIGRCRSVAKADEDPIHLRLGATLKWAPA